MPSRSLALRCVAILIVLACIGVCAPRWIEWWVTRPPTPRVTWTAPAPLSSLLPGRTILRRGIDIGVSPESGDVVLARGGSEKRLSNLSDLRGHVHIDSPEKALEYVRLGSARDYSWGGCGGLEIVRSSDKRAQSGMNGELSPRAYRIGKFAPPTVKRVGSEFVVERWLMLLGGVPDGRPAKVREHVGPDGSYRQEVLPTPPLPPLPDTHWGVPRLR